MLKESIAALMFASLSASALADDLLVPSQYPTIQAAIDAAVDGDQIIIAAGTYREHLDGQNKSLTYTGAGMGQTILSGDLDSDGVADGDVLFVNDNTATEYPSIAMADLTIRDAVNGVYVYRLDQGSFVRCEITGATIKGISISNLDTAMVVDGCDLHDNDTNTYSTSLYVGYTSGGLLVRNSSFRDSGRAANVYDATFEDCIVTGHTDTAINLIIF